MTQRILAFTAAVLSFHFAHGQNVGIGTNTPSNKLTVVAATDPVRFTGMQPAGTTTMGTLVTDNTGVVKIRNASSISAVRVTGTMTFAANNTLYFNDVTAAPTETFDNLGEFSGHTFTPSQPGLYQVSYTINYNQRDNTNDNGEGYMGYAYILAGTPSGTPLTAPTLSSTGNKITIPEASGAPSINGVSMNELVKLSAGEVIQFRATTYGSTGGATASYIINISRVD